MIFASVPTARTHPTNPILPMVRASLTNWDEDEQADGPWDERYYRWQQYAENGDIDPDEDTTEEHFEHARRVLARLARHEAHARLVASVTAELRKKGLIPHRETDGEATA